MTAMNPTDLSPARSFLFVPANRPERYAKALASGAGAVIIDLEDAVPADAKLEARRQLADGLARLSAGERSRLLVRINASGTPWHDDDLLLLASRRAGLAAPVDGVTPGTGDAVQLQRDAERSRRGGFGAKLCIHPAQVALVNAALGPITAELEWARRVLEASRSAGGGVFSLDGRMVDAPVLR